MAKPKVLECWFEMMKTGDKSILEDLLAEEVVFHSPVVHTPQHGKSITKIYLSAAEKVLGGGNFTYTREIIGDGHFMLEFTKEIDGIVINGVDIVQFNEDDQIVDFKVMVRPLKAMQKIHEKMQVMLEQFNK